MEETGPIPAFRSSLPKCPTVVSTSLVFTVHLSMPKEMSTASTTHLVPLAARKQVNQSIITSGKLTLSSGPSTFESDLFVEVGERESRWHNLFGGRLWRKEGK